MRCRFCGQDVSPDDLLHPLSCDGQQGSSEAVTMEAADVPQIVEDDDDPRDGSIADRAERFHRLNPAVYRYAVTVSRYTKRRGLTHYGIGAVWEIMRFKYLETHGDIYKLNNNYRAWYARQIMAREPDLVGFFVTRDCPNDPDYRTRPVLVP